MITRRQLRTPPPGFTLVELLVVMSIMVIMMGLGVLAFRSINGTRSEEAASNLIGGMLARARSEAIAANDTVGVVIFVDPVTDQYTMAIVREPSEFDGALIGGVLPLDFALGADGQPEEQQPLPGGIGFQSILNAQPLVNSSLPPSGANLAPRAGEGYVSTGVVLFDSRGVLTQVPYRFFLHNKPTEAPHNLFCAQFDKVPPPQPDTPYPNNGPLTSQVGFVLFDRATFLGAGFIDTDKQNAPPWADPITHNPVLAYTINSSPPSQADKDAWLDGPQNWTNNLPAPSSIAAASPGTTTFLINRYNGTLVAAK